MIRRGGIGSQNCFHLAGCLDCVRKVHLRKRGLKASHTERFKYKSSPEGRQLESKQQENLTLLATKNTDLDEPFTSAVVWPFSRDTNLHLCELSRDMVLAL